MDAHDHHRHMSARSRPALGLLPALFLLAACRAEGPAAGPFDSLWGPVRTGYLHVSSYDTTGGNRDRFEIPPRDSAVLLDLDGPGVIRRVWITVASRDPDYFRRLALRMYWDGETDPSVAVPLGDFFGNAWDRRHWASLVLGASSGGYFLYLPLPFRRHARIVVDNGSDLPVDAFYFNADVETGAALPRDVATFHAVWSRDRRTTSTSPHRVLRAVGSGRFVGMVFNAESHAGNLGFLEGDETFHVDGVFRGQGTGTEDYFNAGWYFDQGPFAASFHGLVVRDDSLGRIAAYRWHIADPVPFRDSLRIDIEHGHANEEVADYATVGFWYQAEPHAPQAPLPAPEDRLVTMAKLPPGVVTGDSLLVSGSDDSAVIRVSVTMPDRYELLVWPRGAPGAEPVFVAVSGRPPRHRLERDAAAPGPMRAGALDTLGVPGDPVSLEVSGPAAATAISAVELRPIRRFATDWSVLGPFPNPQRLGSEHSAVLDSADASAIDSGSAIVEIAGGRRPRWQPASAGPDGQVRLNPLFEPNDWVAAYAGAWLYAPTEREAALLFGADDANVLWVNGEEVARRQGRNISVADDVQVPVRLRAGWNRVLLLVADLDGGWGFHMRVADPAGELRWSRDPR
jgi:hypothetical protein